MITGKLKKKYKAIRKFFVMLKHENIAANIFKIGPKPLGR